MTNNKQQTTNNKQLTDSIVDRAERELLTPQHFYALCRKLIELQPQARLYFLPQDFDRHLNLKISPYQLCLLFDRLARYVRKKNNFCSTKKFYWQKILIYDRGNIKLFFLLWQKRSVRARNKATKPLEIFLEIAGSGMIGRVARVNIDRERDLALKTFFDPDLVWQHGPWGEIPVSIYLRANQVTKDLPEFKFASEDWAVWEWIYPQTKPQNRVGITYEQFARQQKLTRLNTLNISNYNPHQMRLDIGGIQKEYLGRRFVDFSKGIVFYLRKARREGISSLTKYITLKNVRYICLRIIAIIFPQLAINNLSANPSPCRER
jgi:hypothetical protein